MSINLYPNESLIVNGTLVDYVRIPGGLLEDFKGIVFCFETTDAYDSELHENAVKPLLEKIESKSYDHGTYWDLQKVEALIWKPGHQVTVASFRIRDSY